MVRRLPASCYPMIAAGEPASRRRDTLQFRVAASRGHVQTVTMGANRDQPGLPDLFTTLENRGRSAHPSQAGDGVASPQMASRRHFLPKDLANSIKALDDHDFDRLVAAVLTEQQRRGLKQPSNENLDKQRAENLTVLSSGLLRAIRAALKAGLKPTQIARQFKVSPAEIRNVLANDAGKTK
jgi:hypothetical protein